MDYNQQYLVLAAKLGDIEYKIAVLSAQKTELVEQIKQLDKLVGLVNAQKDQAAKGDNAGNNITVGVPAR